MTYLLDTHILLWSFFEPARLSSAIVDILENRENEIGVSQVSLWEISLKYSLGKLRFGKLKPEDLEGAIFDNGYRILPLANADLFDFYKLPLDCHRDPFDRLLIWQCIKNGYTLLSRDRQCETYRKHGLNFLA